MISGEKILVTGITGSVAQPLAEFLASENEVWGVARFTESAATGVGDSIPPDSKRAALESAGITTRYVDLASGNFDGIPDDFTYVLHLGWMRGGIDQLQDVMKVNVEGTGLLLQHCRKASAALVMSSTAVYSANDDAWHAYSEDDPIGQGVTGQTASTSPASKLGMESVARFCARAFDLPVVIARLNTFMGIPRSFPGFHIGAVLSGQPMVAPFDPSLHTPIHVDDMKDQLEALLDAASTPALVTNWCGDEVTSAQEWTKDAAAWSGKEGKLIVREVAGSPAGNISDPTRKGNKKDKKKQKEKIRDSIRKIK